MRWKGTGIEIKDETVTYQDRHHRNGVAIMLKKRLKTAVTNFLPILDRIIMHIKLEIPLTSRDHIVSRIRLYVQQRKHLPALLSLKEWVMVENLEVMTKRRPTTY